MTSSHVTPPWRLSNHTLFFPTFCHSPLPHTIIFLSTSQAHQFNSSSSQVAAIFLITLFHSIGGGLSWLDLIDHHIIIIIRKR